jgi:hypothetical protein
MTPGQQITFEPTYVKNCRDFYFTANGVSYMLGLFVEPTSIKEMPHTSSSANEIDLKIPKVLATASVIYNKAELTDSANVYALMREMQNANRMEHAGKAYMEGDLNANDESVLQMLYDATVKPLAEKLKAFL